MAAFNKARDEMLDHVTFDNAGVPACMMRQEIAGYRFGHCSAKMLSVAF